MFIIRSECGIKNCAWLINGVHIRSFINLWRNSGEQHWLSAKLQGVENVGFLECTNSMAFTTSIRYLDFC